MAFAGDPATGERRTQFVTVRGTKKDAECELTKRLHQVNEGTYVTRSRETVAEHVRAWLADNTDLAATTRQRFEHLVENQIVPHLGNIAYKTGRKLSWDPVKEDFAGAPEATKLLGRKARKPWDLI